MSFALRRQFSKNFKQRLWHAQFCAPQGVPQGVPQCTPRDPYGNILFFHSATIDHIIPIKFFNTHLSAKQDPLAFFDRYKRAANCQENLQFLDRKTNLCLGSKIRGKLNRHEVHPVDLLKYLNYRYSLEIPPREILLKRS